MNFFKTHNYRLCLLLLLSLSMIGNLTSCKRDRQESIPVYEQREQIGKKIKELSDLLDDAVFGFKKDMYPVESKELLETKIQDLKQLLADIKSQIISPEKVAAETATRLESANKNLAQFIASKRTENLLKNGILHVNGKDGGYIDFGAHPEFSDFNNGPFVVELWTKFVEFGNFDFLLSTFIDNFAPTEEAKVRKGWGINYHGGNMRMTYAIGIKDLYEPPFGNFNTLYTNQWVHLAFVWNPNKDEDGSGSPRTFKMYINGELVKEEDWGNNYTKNTVNTHLYGFAAGNFEGNPMHDRGVNGYMKHMHIWKSLKSKAQIQNYMNSPQSVIGTESDLVCGWNLTEIALDNNAIPDLTGKYTAKLFGNFNWEAL